MKITGKRVKDFNLKPYGNIQFFWNSNKREYKQDNKNHILISTIDRFETYIITKYNYNNLLNLLKESDTNVLVDTLEEAKNFYTLNNEGLIKIDHPKLRLNE